MRKEHVLRDSQFVCLLLELVQHLGQPTVSGRYVGLVTLQTEVILHLTCQDPVFAILLIAAEVFHALVVDGHQVVDEGVLLSGILLLFDFPIHDADAVEINVLRGCGAFVVCDFPIRIRVLVVVHLGIGDEQADIRKTPDAVFTGTEPRPVVHTFLCIRTHYYRRQQYGDTQDFFDFHILIVFTFIHYQKNILSLVCSFNRLCA